MRWCTCRRITALVVTLSACGFQIHGSGGSDGGVHPDDSASDATDAPIDGTIDGVDANPSSMRRKAITFASASLNGSLTDFPVWIDLVDTDIANRARPDGHDIYFTAADGTTRLDHELAGWQSGHLTAWVRVPSLASATKIYVHYGDLAAAPPANPAGVFRANFAATWHLDDALPATTIVDAVGVRAGTPTLTAATTSTTARLGSGLTFTGSNDQISFTNPLTGATSHTISVWVSQPSVTHTSAIIVMGTGTQSHARWMYSHYSAATMAIGFYSNDWVANSNLDGSGFVLLHWTFEGGNGRNRLYRNGVEITGSPLTLNGVNTMGTTGIIGHAPEPTYGTNTGLQATIDELRIATVVRSAIWIAVEYANQSSPSSFYSVGAEEAEP